MPGGKERVAEYLIKSGVETTPREFDSSTRNSALAAEALGCTVAEIAKSVVFSGKEGPIVVVLSGDRKVDVKKLEKLVGPGVRSATPEEVRDGTGYTIGGVPPFPHRDAVRVFPDKSLARFDHVWAAAGSPNAVFRIETKQLLALLGRRPADLSNG